jgi:transposase
MRSYGIDLRVHTLAAYARGEGSIRDVAEQFGVAPRTLVNWLALERTTGSAEPRPHRGGAHGKLTSEHLDVLLGLLRDDIDATLPQLAERLARTTGCVVNRSTIGRALSAAGVTRKKRPPRDGARSP